MKNPPGQSGGYGEACSEVRAGSDAIMGNLDDAVWRQREAEYRSGMRLADIAARHGVTEKTVRLWIRSRGWKCEAPLSDLGGMIRNELSRARAEIAAGDLDMAARRLRTSTSFLRLQRLAEALTATEESGMDDKVNEEKGERFDVLWAELERRLDRLVAGPEPGCVRGGDEAQDRSEDANGA